MIRTPGSFIRDDMAALTEAIRPVREGKPLMYKGWKLEVEVDYPGPVFNALAQAPGSKELKTVAKGKHDAKSAMDAATRYVDDQTKGESRSRTEDRHEALTVASEILAKGKDHPIFKRLEASIAELHQALADTQKKQAGLIRIGAGHTEDDSIVRANLLPALEELSSEAASLAKQLKQRLGESKKVNARSLSESLRVVMKPTPGTKAGSTAEFNQQFKLIPTMNHAKVAGSALGGGFSGTIPQGALISFLPGGLFAKWSGQPSGGNATFGTPIIRSKENLQAILDVLHTDDQGNPAPDSDD